MVVEEAQIRIAREQKERSADDIRSLNAILLIHPYDSFDRQPLMSAASSCIQGSVHDSSLLICI